MNKRSPEVIAAILGGAVGLSTIFSCGAPNREKPQPTLITRSGCLPFTAEQAAAAGSVTPYLGGLVLNKAPNYLQSLTVDRDVLERINSDPNLGLALPSGIIREIYFYSDPSRDPDFINVLTTHARMNRDYFFSKYCQEYGVTPREAVLVGVHVETSWASTIKEHPDLKPEDPVFRNSLAIGLAESYLIGAIGSMDLNSGRSARAMPQEFLDQILSKGLPFRVEINPGVNFVPIPTGRPL